MWRIFRLVVYYIAGAVLSCCYPLLKLLVDPSKALVSLRRFIDLASVQQQQLPVTSRGKAKEREEKKYISFERSIQIM